MILDEDRDELTYLNNEAENGCSNTYQHVTLHLNKTFKRISGMVSFCQSI